MATTINEADSIMLGEDAVTAIMVGEEQAWPGPTYPPPPDLRIPWDLMADIIVLNNTTSIGLGSGRNASNDEVGGGTIGGNTSTSYLRFVFPVPYDITACYYHSSDHGANGTLSSQVSYDTTTGTDGTWGNSGTNKTAESTVTDFTKFRDPARAKSENGVAVKGWRVRTSAAGTTNRNGCHIYGRPSDIDGDYLDFWHPTANQRLVASDIDTGDVKQGKTKIVRFRVKNRSVATTAVAPALSLNILTDPSPSRIAEYSLSLDGENYDTTATLPDLEPGEISPIIWVKRVAAADSAIRATAPRVVITPASGIPLTALTLSENTIAA